jgi:hypothetical protein
VLQTLEADVVDLRRQLGAAPQAGRLDIPLEQQWFTPLHEAAQTGNVKMAQLLLGLGADPDLRSEWGVTPLESARQHGRKAVAELMAPPTGRPDRVA